MANKAGRTEHTGAKHGRGGYYGHKVDAKRESNKRRRENDRKAAGPAEAAGPSEPLDTTRLG